MKAFRLCCPSVALSLLALLVACDSPEVKKPEGPEVEAAATGTAGDGRFSRWSSKAELQFMMEKLSPGEFFSTVEGRHYHGNNQYRAVTEIFDGTRYREWAVFWGLTEKELFDYEITLLRLGFERHFSQVFTDSSGQSLHQLVMLCPVGAEPFDDRPLASAQETSEAIARVPRPEGDESVSAANGPFGDEVAPSDSVDETMGAEKVEVTDSVSAPVIDPPKDPEIRVDTEDSKERKVPADAVVGELDLPVEPVIPSEVKVVEPPKAPVKIDPPKPREVTQPEMRNHIVVKGDTLSSIARRYRVSVAAIKKANGMTTDMIRISQLLKIPAR